MEELPVKIIWIIVWIVAAILCKAYGWLIRKANSGTRFYEVWLGLGIFFLFLAIGVWEDWWTGIPLVGRRVLAGLVLAGLILACLILICILRHFREKGRPGLDAIIVLGAQVRPTGPSVVLRGRLQKAAAYLKQNPDTICIVCGGQGENEPCTEASCMADFLQRQGIRPERIQQEDASETTAENLANSRKFLPLGATIGIVTSDFHMFRALRIAGKQGLTPVCGIAAPSRRLYLPNNLLREILAVVKNH